MDAAARAAVAARCRAAAAARAAEPLDYDQLQRHGDDLFDNAAMEDAADELLTAEQHMEWMSAAAAAAAAALERANRSVPVALRCSCRRLIHVSTQGFDAERARAGPCNRSSGVHTAAVSRHQQYIAAVYLC